MTHVNKSKLHPKNKHNAGYDFQKLLATFPALKEYVFENKHQTTTIDFANPKAVKALNTALLREHYHINYWVFSDKNLTPPIPSRVNYIHYLHDLLPNNVSNKDVTILDVGTGASCIYPLLGNAIYKWNFVATDIDDYAIKSAKNIISKNSLSENIRLRLQKDKANIFNGIVHENDRFMASICNPPFFASQEEAKKANELKLKGLGKEGSARNFSGMHHELWYQGGEKAFLHNYLYQSSLFKSQFFCFTTLVSNKKNIKSMYASLEKLGATDIKTISMHQGNKINRIVAWTFLTKDEQKDWVNS